ncbi:hypothetical protein ABZ915_17455 [Streptomyces sp. NPDC046915]|uniref:hypothetical protein n=1 Tax=Streptomyces sp. NPDC046915 TaxID=3155257 RepID=UPI0033CF3B8F
MSLTSPTISAETARHVLWHYGAEGGYQPGSFTQRLMEAVAAADVVHTARLRVVYPELVDAMVLACTYRDGITRLKEAAGIKAAPLRCTRCQGEDGPFTDEQLCEPCARPMPLDGVA